MPEKQTTYTVLHSAGEEIDGKRIRPYQTFKSVATPELKAKVKKGWLAEGSLSEAEINRPNNNAPKAKRSSRRKSN